MKLFLLLTFAGVIQASASVLSQNNLISMKLQNATVYEAVNEIAHQMDLLFIFQESDDLDSKKINVDLQMASFEDAMKEVLKSSNLSYDLIENYIVVRPVKVKPEALTAVASFQQSERRTITGTVTSAEDGATIPGVSIVVKGTNIGTTTDIDGKYQLLVPVESTHLVFSFVGMVTQEVAINNRAEINIVMELASLDLGELVVVGYGTESRRLVSGSLGVVSDTEIRDVPMRTIDGVLQGRSPGVFISQNSGTPGGANSVRIRGNSSITAGNEPLYVIDGIPMTTGNYGQIGFSGQEINALSDINPNDIESITVLKDASAAAIYGARATNGVILITTKRGSQQRTNINFNGSWGFQKVDKVLKMLNADQWLDYMELEPDPENPVDVNYLDEVFRVTPMSSYELSADGGDERTRFFISGNYFDQTGILLGTDFKRINGRMNLDHQLNTNIKVGASLGTSYSLNNRVEGDRSLHGVLPNSISRPPVYPIYNPDGTYNQDGFFSNPIAIGNEAINEAYSFRTLGNIYGDLRFKEHFTFSTKWGFDYLSLREHSYDPVTTRQGATTNGLGIEAQTNVLNIVSNNLLRYNNTFNSLHNVEALAGYSFEMFQRRSQYAEGIDFPGDQFQYLLDAGTIRRADASATDRGINSFFGQLKYNFDYKYIVSFSGRYDGSSKFGTNNRYGFFPAASLAWRLGEEDFFKALNLPVNEFRLRASYGLTGNDGIPDFAYMDLYRGRSNYLSSAGIAPAALPNPDLKWETTRQINIGADIELFKDRVALTLDYYHNKTSDLLFNRPISMTSGFYSVTTNIGELENRGIEFSLNTVNVTNNDIEWSTKFNISRNRNKVLSLYKNQNLLDLDRYSPNAVIVGEPMSVFYGFRSLGVDPTTGDLVFDDIDGNGVINSDDRVVIGDPNPNFIGGFTSNLAYKSFDLSFFIQFSYGNDVFNATRIFTEAMTYADENQSIEILKRWKQPGDITDIPRADGDNSNENNRISTRFVEDGSFARFKNITLSYVFDRSLTERIGVRNARIFVGATNLFTWTNYSGMDPEVNYRGDSNLLRATDFFTYPQAKTYTIGINLGL
ncbi:MAG: TonB-dependent receptor [Bacteroidales bacterium]|nr:TonB-dependent receptor [Bacteroidales bacterium]